MRRQNGLAINRSMKNIFRLLPLVFACALPRVLPAQTFQQDFENFSALFTGSNPWALANRSDSSAGGLTWFAGTPSIFAAQSGTGYVAASFLSTGGTTGTERISNWFISPQLNLTTGGMFSFFTRSAGDAPDSLEVRLSTNGSSTNVGATSSDVGDFTTLLLAINPTQLAAGMPLAYPTTWTQFTVNLVGAFLPGAIGRIAFRYNVPNSGPNGPNGDYIGVDNLTSNLTVIPEPSTNLLLSLSGLVAGGWLMTQRRRAARTAQPK